MMVSLPHTRRILLRERNSTDLVGGRSFSQEKAWTGRSCEAVLHDGEGRDKRGLRKDGEPEGTKRKGKIREQLRPCLVVRSIELRRKRRARVSLGASVLRESKSGWGDPEEVYEERAENAAQRGFLNLCHAGLARLAARLRSIRIHPAIVFESGGSCWDDAFPRNHPFDVISLITYNLGSTARELMPYLSSYSRC